MELKRAKEVLAQIKNMPASEMQTEKRGSRLVRFYISIPGYSFNGEFWGDFTSDERDAIATWMRDPEGVVKA